MSDMLMMHKVVTLTEGDEFARLETPGTSVRLAESEWLSMVRDHQRCLRQLGFDDGRFSLQTDVPFGVSSRLVVETFRADGEELAAETVRRHVERLQREREE